MAVNLSKEAYRQTEVIREITPVHILTEEQSIHATNEVTPVHLLKEEDTITRNEIIPVNEESRTYTPIHIVKEEDTTIVSVYEEENNTECTSTWADEPPFICTLIVPVLTVVFGVVLLFLRNSIATSMLKIINGLELGEAGEELCEIYEYFFSHLFPYFGVMMTIIGVSSLFSRLWRRYN